MQMKYLELMGIGLATALTASALVTEPPESSDRDLNGRETAPRIEERLADTAISVARAAADTLVRRVGGNPEAELERVGDRFRAGRAWVRESLPEGYPPPTPPGAIELKWYPTVRRAEHPMGRANGWAGSTNAFWPLFRHIESRGIPMTSPVEFIAREPDAEGAAPAVDDPREISWSMAFLYESDASGPIESNRGVEVIDSEPIVVVSLGLRGPGGLGWALSKRGELDRWIRSQNEWQPDGPPRVLSYNGPSVPRRDRWHEVQIPLRAIETDADAGD